MNATRNTARQLSRKQLAGHGVQAPLQHALLASMIAAALVLPAMAFAQDDASANDEQSSSEAKSPELLALTETKSIFEFGFGYISDNSFRFGKYTGLENKGGFGVFNLDYINRASYDAPARDYVTVRGTDMGLRSRSIEVDAGRQGDFRVRVSYDQIPSFKSDSAQSMYDGVGTDTLTLPSGWVPSATTAGMTQLIPNLRPVDIKTERERFGVRMDKILPGNFEVSTNYRYEEKDGLKSIAGVFGNTGGNPRAAILPEPVNYNEHQFDTVVRYSEKKYQFELSYHLSIFGNENTGLTFQNPFSAINGWVSSTGFPTGFGEMALPPDNKFQQGTAKFGYNFTDSTRLLADVAIGRMSQNDTFLALTLNPTILASITEPLPRNSLQGEINTTVINLRLSSRPTRQFNWGASFRYDDRDNNTPIDIFNMIGADSQLQNPADISNRRRLNQPYSYEETKFGLNAGYRLDDGTRFTAVAEHREIDRTFSERAETRENTFTVSASRSFGEQFDGSVRYTYADRGGSPYDGTVPLQFGFVEGFLEEEPGGFEAPPALRRFTLASRERNQIGANLSYTPISWLALSVDGSYSKDNYNKSELGLTDSKVQSYTFDLSATPVEQWTTYAFYTYDKLDSDQNGVSFSSGANRLAQVTDPNRFWSAFHNDRIDTVGAGLVFKPDDQRFRFGADFVYALSKSDIDFSAGSNLTTAPLPTNRVSDTTVSLFGQYQMTEKLGVRATLYYQRYHSSDIALDGVEANQLANVILLGDQAPDFTGTAATVSLIYAF